MSSQLTLNHHHHCLSIHSHDQLSMITTIVFHLVDRFLFWKQLGRTGSISQWGHWQEYQSKTTSFFVDYLPVMQMRLSIYRQLLTVCRWNRCHHAVPIAHGHDDGSSRRNAMNRFHMTPVTSAMRALLIRDKSIDLGQLITPNTRRSVWKVNLVVCEGVIPAVIRYTDERNQGR